MKETFYAGIASPDKTCAVINSLMRPDVVPSIHVKYDNREALSKVYNGFIDEATELESEWLILCHNDIEIETDELLWRIINSGYDVVGVAGPTKADFRGRLLWHHMGGGFQSGCLRGAVAHSIEGVKAMSGFGTYPARTVMLDGVFMAIKREVFTKLRFDERNPAKFHFYDLDYTLSAHEAGFKVGVGDILITHDSPGLLDIDNKEWKEGEQWFRNKNS